MYRGRNKVSSITETKMTCDGSSSQELLASKYMYLWQFNVLRVTVITEIKIPVTVQVQKNYWILRSKYLWQ